jgi:hypothetical protein
MEANGEVTEPHVGLDADGHAVDAERKRILHRPEEQPAAKRAKAEDGSPVVKREREPPETAVKPLPKGTAPVKQE